MELSIERDGALVVRAPAHAKLERLEAFIREKRGWVYTKLAEKQLLRRAATTKEFITGEGFRYLGRSYRLLLVARQRTPLRLDAGRFKLLRSEVRNGRGHFLRWYVEHGREWLARRAKQYAPRVGAKPPGVEVRDLGFRWGSCGHGGTLNFHWATILLPPGIVDYVLVHELVHLHEPHHTPKFWQRVERVMPDYAARKRWLAERAEEVATF
jgi:hypothetical protein